MNNIQKSHQSVIFSFYKKSKVKIEFYIYNPSFPFPHPFNSDTRKARFHFLIKHPNKKVTPISPFFKITIPYSSRPKLPKITLRLCVSTINKLQKLSDIQFAATEEKVKLDRCHCQIQAPSRFTLLTNFDKSNFSTLHQMVKYC